MYADDKREYVIRVEYGVLIASRRKVGLNGVKHAFDIICLNNINNLSANTF